MAKAIKARKPDICRLVVEIRGIAYTVKPSPCPAGLRSWKLTREDGEVAYVVAESAAGPTCTCPDDRFRHKGGCKHSRALVALGLIRP